MRLSPFSVTARKVTVRVSSKYSSQICIQLLSSEQIMGRAEADLQQICESPALLCSRNSLETESVVVNELQHIREVIWTR